MTSTAGAMSVQISLTHAGKTHNKVLALGEVAYIGRASRCAMQVEDMSVSSTHVELSLARADDGSLVLRAKDKSQNGTGYLADASKVDPDESVRPLSSDSPEDIVSGAGFVIPYRRKGNQGKVEAATERTLFEVKILPGSTIPSTFSTIPSAGAAQTAAPLPARAVPFAGLLPSTHAPGAPGPTPACRAKAAATAAAAAAARTPDPALAGANLPDRFDPATGSGRWLFDSKIGEGGLAVVYRATDCTGGLGEVAVKVLKHPERANWGKQFAYSMHRESQWSLQQLHQEGHPQYDAKAARLFARYLEDHTGYDRIGPSEFEAKRRLYEHPDFDWEKNGPALDPQPYVVMELALGDCLNAVMDRERYSKKGGTNQRILTNADKRQVLTQAVQALEYLAKFGLIHRDFRGCNMHLAGADSLDLKVLDLGVMISSEDGMEWNTNQAVQAFRRRGETMEKKQRYDWLPWEVRAGADGSAPAVNFSLPVHAFDVFSFGVLVLHLVCGRGEARNALETVRIGGKMVDTSCVGLDPHFVRKMLGDASRRPSPSEVVRVIQAGAAASPRAELALERPARSRSPRRPARAEDPDVLEEEPLARALQMAPPLKLAGGANGVADIPLAKGISEYWIITYPIATASGGQ